jgi:Zn-dependent M28 family amino/carboxypeptidase
MSPHRLAVAACILVAAACAPAVAPRTVPSPDESRPDTIAIAALARDLSSDARAGRGPWTEANEDVARRLAAELHALGARPVFGPSILVPFAAERRPTDTVHNVIAVLPNRDRDVGGRLVGLTAHFDGLGIGRPDADGDSIYNGFLDAAVPVAMVIDVARRYARRPGDRPLLILLFNLEEQGLLGARALGARPDAEMLIERIALLIGVDAGAPAGEAVVWQLMGASPPHPGAAIADSLARARGWTTTATPPRAISDVFIFAERGVPILFPIPGAQWRGYSDTERAEAMARWDHYHQPGDEWKPDWPWTGTAAYADWLWDVVRHAAERGALP